MWTVSTHGTHEATIMFHRCIFLLIFVLCTVFLLYFVNREAVCYTNIQRKMIKESKKKKQQAKETEEVQVKKTKREKNYLK